MTAPSARGKAWAQLLRLPNVFTAIADPLAGWLIAGSPVTGLLGVVLGLSACLYTAGIVFNDCFDYAADCRDRPQRPLPRGAVSRRAAWTLAGALLFSGLGLAAWAGARVLAMALPLAALILWYDAAGKRSGWLGPLLLGACRALNLRLGMVGSGASVLLFWPPLVLGVYVASLSLLARREEVRPAWQPIVKRLLLGIIVVDAALVLAGTGNGGAAALVLALLVPAAILGRILPMT